MINRRQFLASLSGLPVLVAFPLHTIAAGTRRYELSASLAEYPLGGPDKPVSPLMLYNGKSPGPKLKARKGETLEINFNNQLDQPTTIHWHGIRNLNCLFTLKDWVTCLHTKQPCVLLALILYLFYET